MVWDAAFSSGLVQMLHYQKKLKMRYHLCTGTCLKLHSKSSSTGKAYPKASLPPWLRHYSSDPLERHLWPRPRCNPASPTTILPHKHFLTPFPSRAESLRKPSFFHSGAWVVGSGTRATPLHTSASLPPRAAAQVTSSPLPHTASLGYSFKVEVPFIALQFYEQQLPGDNDLVNRDEL